MSNVAVKKSDIHGMGLFAEKTYKAGVPILEIDDSLLVDSEEQVKPTSERRFLDKLNDGTLVLLTGPEKWCNWPKKNEPANTVIEVNGKKRKLVAVETIYQGEEITSEKMMR